MLVAIAGLLLSLAALAFGSVRGMPNRPFLLICLLAMHISVSVIYYYYALAFPADTGLYYYDPAKMEHYKFEFGTVFVVQTVQALREAFGGSYLDYFIFFQAFGFWGIVLLYRTFQEMQLEIGASDGGLGQWLLLLPGLHFWSCAIGKDAPLLLASALAVWSAMHFRRRLPAFALAITLMVLFRPHVALVATIALALTALFDRRSSLLAKLGLLTVAIAASAYVAATVESAFNVDVTSSRSVSEFFATQYEVSQQIGGGTAVHDASFGVRLLSLLFRPLFFDINGPLALVASFENLFFIGMVAYLIVNWRESLRLASRVFFLRFALLYVIALVLMLTLVFYNVGLGARQKTMMLPALFTFLVAHWSLHRSRRKPPRVQLVQAPA
jgi:hypothetical protein